MQRNLICVKWGKLYGPEYVLNLYSGVKRHMDKNFAFHVFTDDDSHIPKLPGLVIHRLPAWRVPNSRGWWFKMEIFNAAHNLKGRNLYVDLDVIITGNCKEMWNFASPNFIICHDFNRAFIPSYNGVNSSVMCWSDSDMHWLYERFQNNRDEQMLKHRGDQDFIQAEISQYQFFPKEWAMSYRWEIWRGGHKDGRTSLYHSDEHASIIPQDCKMVIFHGKPKPHEITEQKLTKLWTPL